MIVVAIAMFRNEADVAEYVVRHMLDECDLVVVADNNSTDGSREILEAIDDQRLSITEEPSVAYRQAETMQRLTHWATVAGAHWVVPFDFDEWWTADGGTISEALHLVSGHVTAGDMVDMIPQPGDGDIPDPFRRIVWTRPGSVWSPHVKVAFRPGPGRVLVQGNHGLEGEDRPDLGPLHIRHFPFRSKEQARAKLRHGREAVTQADLPLSSGWHWREWGAYGDDEFDAWWDAWTDPKGLVRWPA